MCCNTFELDADGLLTGRIATPIIWGARKPLRCSGSAASATSN